MSAIPKQIEIYITEDMDVIRRSWLLATILYKEGIISAWFDHEDDEQADDGDNHRAAEAGKRLLKADDAGDRQSHHDQQRDQVGADAARCDSAHNGGDDGDQHPFLRRQHPALSSSSIPIRISSGL